MMNPIKHNELLDEIQASIRATGQYEAEVDSRGKAEIDEVTMFAVSQYRPDQALSTRSKQVSESRWVIAVADPYRPEGG